MSKVERLTTTEEVVLNPKYRGLRVARIEAYVEGETYPVEVGKIEVWNDNLLFDEVRDIIWGARKED